MDFVGRFRSAFSRSPDLSIPEPPDREKTTVDRRRALVSRFSRGSTFLQRGRFSMREDLDRAFEKIKSYKFQD